MLLTGLFPTSICHHQLHRGGRSLLNRRLGDECRALRLADAAGRRWSREHYAGGYTSYGTHSRLHLVSSLFGDLERAIRPHVRHFIVSLAYDMRGRRLEMTDCWANIMGPQTVHSGHLHPLSFISGTYYVAVPPGAAPLKFEDPRLAQFMAAPPRRRKAPAAQRPFFAVAPQAGDIVLFESWLRHEVPAGHAKGERISISFNYAWREI